MCYWTDSQLLHIETAETIQINETETLFYNYTVYGSECNLSIYYTAEHWEMVFVSQQKPNTRDELRQMKVKLASKLTYRCVSDPSQVAARCKASTYHPHSRCWPIGLSWYAATNRQATVVQTLLSGASSRSISRLFNTELHLSMDTFHCCQTHQSITQYIIS